MGPNLFDYATTELSQDAFIAWLLAWADNTCDAYDPSLHGAACSLVRSLLEMHNVPAPPFFTVGVHRQLLGADLVAEVGSDFVILIEDKIHAGIHGDQLSRYLQEIGDRFPGRRILPIFLKTGDQSSYKAATDQGYKLLLRSHILNLLRPWRDRTPNSIFNDFVENLEWREAEVESYLTKPVSEWTQEWEPWKGFFKRLQRELSDTLEWDYVANASGGFLGAWWGWHNWRDPETGIEHDVYLQIEAGESAAPLCFKVAHNEEDLNRSALWERWYSSLTSSAEQLDFALKRARRRPGTYMTVGRIELNDWMFTDDRGFLDVTRTLEKLRSAASLLDHASALRVS